MLEDEIRTLLLELCRELGASAARITRSPSAGDLGAIALGSGSFLVVELGRAGDGFERAAILERAARALRLAARRWETDELPEIAFGEPEVPRRDRIFARITQLLEALTNVQHGQNALVVRRDQVIASAKPLEALEEARWKFIFQRTVSTALRPHGSSHAELCEPDFFAASFWYDAVLIVYFAAPYAEDFVRHRARMVTRELSALLPMLDPDPPSGAAVAQPD